MGIWVGEGVGLGVGVDVGLGVGVGGVRFGGVRLGGGRSARLGRDAPAARQGRRERRVAHVGLPLLRAAAIGSVLIYLLLLLTTTAWAR